MKDTITESSFINNWPESRSNSFSYAGLKALFEWYSQLEEDTGEEFEYDPVAFCCEWTEYESWVEAEEDYNMSCREMRDATQTIETSEGSILVMEF